MSPPSLQVDGHGVATAEASDSTKTVEERESQIKAMENEIARLKAENAALKDACNNNYYPMSDPRSSAQAGPSAGVVGHDPRIIYQSLPPLPPLITTDDTTKLSSDQIERYSRQLLLADGFGVVGQQKLLSSSVLVVGAGGIGSTVLLYLAASGIGRISVLDFDCVEMSNLHRQIIHKQKNVGMNKAVSACLAISELNPTVQCQPLPIMLTHENALQIVKDHDCIVDASDNPRTRYLINDACVLAGGDKPLISGSAIGTEGQLSVFNWKGGPCYRCLYPKPSITAGAKSCSDSGVLGPVPGLIGVLQALEVLKVLTDTGNAMNDRMLMYDSLQCSFLNIKKPKKQINCPVCSDDEHATIRSMQDSHQDLQSARGPATCDAYVPAPLDEEYQVSCQDYYNSYQQQQQQEQQSASASKEHILLDVRVKEQYDLCSLPDAINIPLDKLHDNIDQVASLTNEWTKPVYCICRRGVFSVEATKFLNDYISKLNKIEDEDDKQTAATATTTTTVVKNIRGGLEAWRKQVDETFPKY